MNDQFRLNSLVQRSPEYETISTGIDFIALCKANTHRPTVDQTWQRYDFVQNFISETRSQCGYQKCSVLWRNVNVHDAMHQVIS